MYYMDSRIPTKLWWSPPFLNRRVTQTSASISRNMSTRNTCYSEFNSCKVIGVSSKKGCVIVFCLVHTTSADLNCFSFLLLSKRMFCSRFEVSPERWSKLFNTVSLICPRYPGSGGCFLKPNYFDVVVLASTLSIQMPLTQTYLTRMDLPEKRPNKSIKISATAQICDWTHLFFCNNVSPRIWYPILLLYRAQWVNIKQKSWHFGGKPSQLTALWKSCSKPVSVIVWIWHLLAFQANGSSIHLDVLVHGVLLPVLKHTANMVVN